MVHKLHAEDLNTFGLCNVSYSKGVELSRCPNKATNFVKSAEIIKAKLEKRQNFMATCSRCAGGTSLQMLNRFEFFRRSSSAFS